METNIIETTASQLKNIELFLLNLRYKEGQLLHIEGNRPLLLNDPESAWVVYAGTIDVFSVPVRGDEVTGTRTHLFRSGMGQLLLGIDGSNYGRREVSLLVSGTPGTRVLQLKRSRLLQLAADAEYKNLVIAMIQDWVRGLSLGVFDKILPKEYTLLETGQTHVLAVDEPTVATPKKGVVWVEVNVGKVEVVGEPTLTFSNANNLLPAAPFVWLRATEAAKLKVLGTEHVLTEKRVWASLDAFHRLVLDAIVLNQTRQATAELERIHKKAESERLVMENALLSLRSTLVEDTAFVKALTAGQNALWSACELVGEALDVGMVAPARTVMETADDFELLNKIAQTSRIRIREVALRRTWWKQDNGPLLAFTIENRPVALIPKSPSQYEIVDPIKKTKTDLNATLAQQLAPLAYSFYKPFPDEALNAWKVIKFGVSNSGTDLRRLLLIGIALGLLRLLPPIATGEIFNRYIPEANVNGLLQMGIGLLVVALAVGLFQIAQGVTLLRIQSKMDASIQSALWDRLLNLPLPFFRQYTAGNLGNRVMGITAIRRILSGYIINTILTFIFTSFNLVLLFFYSVPLALLAIGLVILALTATIVASAISIRIQRELSETKGILSGLVLQLLTGIVKLRITASENQAFSLWTEQFVRQKKFYYQMRRVTNNLATLNAIYPLFASLAIFAMVAYSATFENLSTGNFLAFNLAFVQFLTAWMQMSGSVATITTVVPIYERLKPILETEPEVDDVKISPQTLTGAIEVSHVSFRYSEKTPLVLKDVSMDIASGEFVAFVGHSGSGKSTMMRLLLGFDTVESGGIYYDGQDLADLDLREVRQQLGVVLQNSVLMTGDIYENIVGASNLTVEDAWEAAEMVGLSQDIQMMPMGMNTVVTSQGNTLSGGQRQRILIARAIVNRPRVLFFDEATSALDNRTQEIVSQSLEGLQATRIVIAHRLSTVINADQIYVFDKGEIAQSGTYEELISQPGPFAELAKRQML